MVVWAAERFKLDLISLEMDAEGEVEEFLDRTSWFKQVTIRPRIVVTRQITGSGATGAGHGHEVFDHQPVFQIKGGH